MTWTFRLLTKSHSAKSQKNRDLKLQDSWQSLYKMIKRNSLDIVLCMNMYLFFYLWFKDIVSSLDNTASNGRTNWDGRDKKLPWRDKVN